MNEGALENDSSTESNPTQTPTQAQESGELNIPNADDIGQVEREPDVDVQEEGTNDNEERPQHEGQICGVLQPVAAPSSTSTVRTTRRTLNRSVSAAEVTSTPKTTTTTGTTPSDRRTQSNSATTTAAAAAAARILFRDQQLQLLRNAIDNNNRPTLSSNNNGNVTVSRATRPINRSPSIVEFNRRLIERQIEAIRMADSRRWNFDFRNCRPLNISGHRFVQCSSLDSVNNNSINSGNSLHHHHATVPPQAAQRNCRPLNDKNQTQEES